MTRTFLAAALAATLGITACSTGSGDAAPAQNPNLASYSLTNSDLGNDFTGNFVWIRGTRSVAADGKYPCLSEFQVCVPTDAAGRTMAIQDLCPSTDTPEGTWTFEYYLAADEACAEPLGNLYCEIQRGEVLRPGSNTDQVRCTTRNADKTFDICVYDPVTGAGAGNCLPESCETVNGLNWCYDPMACGENCTEVCASLGMALIASDQVWFEAQDTEPECQAIADAFGVPQIIVDHWAWACIEDTPGVGHTAPGGLNAALYCSTWEGCPAAHRTAMDQYGIPCGDPAARRSLCPCE
jgi:hypothetical protein